MVEMISNLGLDDLSEQVLSRAVLGGMEIDASVSFWKDRTYILGFEYTIVIERK